MTVANVTARHKILTGWGVNLLETITQFVGEPECTARVSKDMNLCTEKAYEALFIAYKSRFSQFNAEQLLIEQNAGTAREKVRRFVALVMTAVQRFGLPIGRQTCGGIHPERLARLVKASDVWCFFQEVANRVEGAGEFLDTLEGDLERRAEMITEWMESHGARFEGVNSLTLTNLSLSHLPSQIGMFTNLSSLFLGNNHLSHLPKEICLCTKLSCLVLANNCFTEMPAVLSLCERITELDMSHNRLWTFTYFSKELKIVELSHNAFQDFPHQLCTDTIKCLNLSHNHLKSIAPEIGQCTNLQSLGI
ncbi:MAG: leucine-rich repeat domain-containing protein, partial [Chlamydiales bacterium]